MVTNKHLDCSKVNMPFANISITNAFVKTTGLYLNSFYDTNYPNGKLVYEMIIGCPEMCMNTTRLVTDMYDIYVVMSKTYEAPFVSTLDEKTFGPNLDIRLYYDNILGSQKGITSPYVYSMETASLAYCQGIVSLKPNVPAHPKLYGDAMRIQYNGKDYAVFRNPTVAHRISLHDNIEDVLFRTCQILDSANVMFDPNITKGIFMKLNYFEMKDCIIKGTFLPMFTGGHWKQFNSFRVHRESKAL